MRLCPQCFYNLQDLQASACPECGTHFNPADTSSYLMRKPSWPARHPAALLLLGLVVLGVLYVTGNAIAGRFITLQALWVFFFLWPVALNFALGLLTRHWISPILGLAVIAAIELAALLPQRQSPAPPNNPALAQCFADGHFHGYLAALLALTAGILGVAASHALTSIKKRYAPML